MTGFWRSSPRAFDALYNRGVILSQKQRFEEALTSLDQAVLLQPGMAAVHYNRGVVLAGLNRNGEAMAAYNRALALDPNYSPARTNRTLVALTLCDWDWVAQITPEQAFETAPPLALLGIFADKALQLQMRRRRGARPGAKTLAAPVARRDLPP